METRVNPVRATRPQNAMIDASNSENSDNTEESEPSPFFSPPEEDRGCPTCRKVPINSLRLFPDDFKCPVCLTEDTSNVFALVPCGHCLCGDCRSRWMPDTNVGSPRLPDVANLNISNQGAASGRRGRPLMSPHERNANSTRQRKGIIMKAIENWEFNNGIILDAIFYCDIPETFQSPDEEPREVFRQRLTDAMNTEENGDFDRDDNSWVHALHRLSVHFDGQNPLEFVNYTITTSHYHNGGIGISLTIPLVKGLQDKDVLGSITEDDYDLITIHDLRYISTIPIIGEPPSRDECISYFANNIMYRTCPTFVTEGEDLVDPSEIFD